MQCGVGTVLCRVPHVAAAGVVVDVTKGEYQGVGGPDELVGYTSGGSTGVGERYRWVARSGVSKPHRRCAADDTSEKLLRVYSATPDFKFRFEKSFGPLAPSDPERPQKEAPKVTPLYRSLDLSRALLYACCCCMR